MRVHLYVHETSNIYYFFNGKYVIGSVAISAKGTASHIPISPRIFGNTNRVALR